MLPSRWISAAVILGLFTAPALACNVPVYRYALERWPADPYELFVFHRGPLDEESQQAIGLLEKGEPRANAVVTAVDLDAEPDEALVKLFEREKEPQLPWLVVRYPLISGIGVPVWSGKLNADNVKALVDSPVRQAIGKKLLAGETAVWVILESGKKKLDDDAAKLIDAELAKLPKKLKLPVLTDTPADEILGKETPLKIAFSTIRLSRDNPAEAALIKMLLTSEEDLTTYEEPMVFPVFGRGRALYALVGKGINADNIKQAGDFLVGPCSCEIKRLNPGVDLLFRTDWEIALQNPVVKNKEPELVGLGSLTPVKNGDKPDTPENPMPPPEVKDTPSSDPEAKGEDAAASVAEKPKGVRENDAVAFEDTPVRNSNLMRNLIVALAGGLLLVALAALGLRTRGRQ